MGPRCVIHDVLGKTPLIGCDGKLWIGKSATCLENVTCVSCGLQTGLVVAGVDPKTVVVLRRTNASEPESYKDVMRYSVPKRIAAIALTPDEKYVLVADRMGDVYSLSTTVTGDETASKSTTVDENSAPLLGHFSMITDIATCEERVATCDRDNRVRVSKYPLAVDIQSFCMGHTDYVSRVEWINGHVLLSGGGDGFVRLWGSEEGKELANVKLQAMGKQQSTASVVCCLSVDVTTKRLAVAVIHECREIFVLSVVDNQELKILTTFVPPEVGEDGTVFPTAAMFGDDGRLWVSLRDSHRICAYAVEEKDGGKSVDLHMVQEMEIQAGEEKPTTGKGDVDGKQTQTPGEWLAGLRKKEMVDNWKGRKRRRTEDDDDGEGAVNQ